MKKDELNDIIDRTVETLQGTIALFGTGVTMSAESIGQIYTDGLRLVNSVVDDLEATHGVKLDRERIAANTDEMRAFLNAVAVKDLTEYVVTGESPTASSSPPEGPR